MSSVKSSSHPSRRDNQSVSSNHSNATSSRSERGSRSQGNPAVESAVTRLLVAIKQLLESLTLWSTQKVSEAEVSDVYVRLGNDFNAAVAAFAAFNIDMSELMSVPDDLRAVLEQCLAEDATPENLENFLPDVRKIITKLLQGLRGKQSIYRRIVSEHKHQSSTSAATDRPESRASSSKHESTTSNRKSSRGMAESSDSLARRSASSKGRKESTSGFPPRPPVANGSDHFVGGFAVGFQNGTGEAPNRSSAPSRSQTPRQPSSANGYPPSRASSASAVDPSHQRELPPYPSQSPQLETPPLPRPPSVYSPVPSHVPRFSLSDKPISSPTPPPPAPSVVIDEAPPQPHNDDTPPSRTVDSVSPSPSPIESPPIDSQVPAVQSSLAALKKSDVLERRASKRFSTYNISKMTGGSIRERLNGSHATRLSMAASNALTPGDLAVLTEAEEEPSPHPKRERGKTSSRSRNPSPIAEDEEPPPVPPLPSRDASPHKPAVVQAISEPKAPPSVSAYSPSPVDSSPRSFPVFLQVGREVKKVMMEPGLSFSSLRVLFVDRFAYSPGMDNFPAIYIRDPSSGVQYELEDMDEVKEKCLLSLNIEPLDQIKQHIDLQISSLSQDIKDLRTAVANNRRASLPPPMIIGRPLSESTPAPPRPSERSFRNVARHISRLMPDIPDEQITPVATRQEALVPQQTGASLQPQMTGVSVMSEYSSRVVTDLKTQFDEVQNLRRDLGIMRQLYTEFMKNTKESLGTLRAQTQNVRQLATAKVGGARAYIDDGKTKLDSRSQNVLTKMEELQDTVENIKDDVLKRNISPRAQILRNVKAGIESVSAELESLKDHIQTIKPMWKKTWEEELQNIVEEQQFLSHQEEFLNDLLEDHKAAVEVYGHVEKVISLRGTAPSRGGRTGRGFRPPPPDEGHTGLSTVMLEIRSAAVDQERRMKAIAANEKNREKELAGRSDEFEAELTGFVSGKKLKMTGGAEEAERVRQRRNETTLKAMFSGSTTPSSPGVITPSSSMDTPLPPSSDSQSTPKLAGSS